MIAVSQLFHPTRHAEVMLVRFIPEARVVLPGMVSLYLWTLDVLSTCAQYLIESSASLYVSVTA